MMLMRLYVGNAYGGTFNEQTHTGALIADYLNLSGIEAYRCEAGDASGGVALRTAYLAVASGSVDCALVIGVEKCTDIVGAARTSARSISLDGDYESLHGATLPTMAALLMRRYMHVYDLDISAFEGFSVNAHRNGSQNTYAMYRNQLRPGSFGRAPIVADPVNLFDSAPDADGAAALVLVPSEHITDKVAKPVNISASNVSTDRFMLQERDNPLFLNAVGKSVASALEQAGITRDDVDLFEVHDAFTILSALTMEAAGFSEDGQGWQWASENGAAIALNGTLPISTMGGLKSRGNPAGATGIYQAVEACLQLKGEAGDNQVVGAKTAMIQNLGGLASTAVTHILQVDES